MEKKKKILLGGIIVAVVVVGVVISQNQISVEPIPEPVKTTVEPLSEYERLPTQLPDLYLVKPEQINTGQNTQQNSNQTQPPVSQDAITIEQIKGIIYKPSSKDKITDEIRLKDFTTGKDVIIGSSAKDVVVSADKKSVYFTKISGSGLEIYEYSVANNFSTKVYNKNFSTEIQSIELINDGNNKLVFIATLVDPVSANKDVYEQESVQQIYMYDIQQNKEEKLYDDKVGVFFGLTLLASNGDGIYFTQSTFEGPSSLVKFNIKTHSFENISDAQKFSLTHTAVSPNQRYVGMSTLSYVGTDIVNKLSFYDMSTQKLIHSQLQTSASGEFPGGLSDFRYIIWANDSSFVYAATGKGGAFFPLHEGRDKDNKYYFVRLDGSVSEQVKLKQMESEIQIAKLIDNKTALVAKRQLGIKESDLYAQKISLTLFDLISYQTKAPLINSITPFADIFENSFIGFVE